MSLESKISIPNILLPDEKYTLDVIPYNLMVFFNNLTNLGTNHNIYNEYYTISKSFDIIGFNKLKTCKYRSYFANLCSYKFHYDKITPYNIKTLAEELAVNDNVKTVYMEIMPTSMCSLNAKVKHANSNNSPGINDLVEKFNTVTTDVMNFINKSNINSIRPTTVDNPNMNNNLLPIETPDLRYLQENYMGYTTISGLDVNRSQNISLGEFIRVHHIDDYLIQNHENFNNTNLTLIDDYQPNNQLYLNNGTSSSGIIAGNNINIYGNVKGTRGIAPKCEFYFYTYDGLNDAYLNCRPGDIFSLETQFPFKSNDKPEILLPAVYSNKHYDMVKILVEFGAVVIFSAGNGGINIIEHGEMPDNNADSGGIMCCAINQSGNRSDFSNYNYYKSLNALGNNVVTCGHGDIMGDASQPLRSYTRTYNGTNAAQSQIAGCLALIQSSYYKHYHRYMNTQTIFDYTARYGVDNTALQIGYRPKVLRTILHVGKLFNTRSKLDRLNSDPSYFRSQLDLHGSLFIEFDIYNYMKQLNIPNNPPAFKYILIINRSNNNLNIICNKSPFELLDYEIKPNDSLILESSNTNDYNVIQL